MKKLFTIFVLIVLFVSTSFASYKCVYIVATDATNDQKIIDYLTANGYTVTVSVANGTVPAGEYDLAVLSETIGSTNNTWKAFRNAALPFVSLKTFSARGNTNSLSWLSTNATGSDYANTTDLSATTADASHPILADIPVNPTFLFQTGTDATGNPAALQWLNFPALPQGATVITTVTIGTGTTYTVSGQIPQIIAFERNTTMNIAKLANRAVIAGFNYFANSQLTNDALKVIKQSCDWVAAGGISNAAKNLIQDQLLMKKGSELINPTNLEVDIYTASGARVLCSKESIIKLSSLNKGIYIANTNAGVLKFAI